MTKKEETLYEVLKISSTATHSEIVAAYHDALNAFSHDSLATYSLLTPEQTQEQLTRIEEAYATLSNLDRKQQYDRKLLNPSVVSLNLPRPEVRATAPKLTPAPLSALMTPTSEAASAPTPVLTSAPNPSPIVPSHKNTPAVPDPLASASPTPEVSLPNPPPEPTMAPGTLLIDGRTKVGMTLEEVNRITKISVRYLKAMENQNFEHLPARVYLQGFLKNLAHLYKLDGAALTQAYLKLLDEKSAAAIPPIVPV